MNYSIAIICLATAALLPNWAEANPLKASEPNIVLVMTDDQGMGDLSCMGNKVVRTPNIDRFYGKSLRFTDFHVSPTCAPTRAAIMSGRPPFKVGVTHTIFQRERMAPDVFTLPQALKSAGYTTGLFGKWHLGDEEACLPQNRGFDEVLMHGSGGIGQVSLGDFPPSRENVLKNPDAAWADRSLFVHCGQWDAGKRDAAKYTKCAVRTTRWRFSNNSTLYDIENDPSETTDVSAEYPEVFAKLRATYDQWWDSTESLLVNEGLPRVAPDQQPLALRYHKQLKERGIPDWAPAKLEDGAACE